MSAEYLDWTHKAEHAADLARLAHALREGELVGLPTETVYGIAARADLPRALERLQRVKATAAARAFTWHVASAEALRHFSRLAGPARRLSARYWPGPLTLVLSGVPAGLDGVAQNGWTGVRMPAHERALEIIAALEFPLVASSANLAGAPPLLEAQALRREFGLELAFVVDGGRARMGEASTVLQLGPGTFRVLREGLIDARALRRAAGLSIAFVCTGNTCRSPLAMTLARARLALCLDVAPERIGEFGFEVASFGLLAGAGEPASEHAQALMAQRGLDLSQHRSQRAVPEELVGFDRIYAMTRRHLEALVAALPPSKREACSLLDPAGRDLPDPIGGPLQAYAECAARIEQALEQRAREWLD